MGVNGIYGLSGSGMDVDSMVEKMMNAKRQPYNKMYQKKTKAEWTKTAYNNLYSSISTFRSSQVFNYKLQSTLSPKKVTTSGTDADKAAVSVSANADASIFSHTVEVNEVAQAANMTSKGTIKFETKDTSGNVVEDKNMKLSSLLGDTLPPAMQAYNDQRVVVTTAQDKFTAAQIALAQDPTDATLKQAVTDAQTELVTQTNTLTSLGKVQVINLEVSDGVNSGSIKYSAADMYDANINDFTSDIDKLGLNIDASFDKKLGRVFLYNSTSGDQSKISVEAKPVSDGMKHGQMLLQGLNFMAKPADPADPNDPAWSKTTVSTADAGDGFVAGHDAEFIIDGMTVKSDKNNVTVNNITYTANAKTTGQVKLQVNSDIDGTVDAIKKFVDEYNKILDSYNTIVSEKVYKGYDPLTDEQKKEMSDDQIKQWEANAKSGLLRGDDILERTISGMRNDISGIITGTGSKYNSASSIGITTKNWKEGGKLYLEESVLRTALEADPKAVSRVFATDGDDQSEKGIAQRLDVTLQKIMVELDTKAGTPANSKDDTQSTMAEQIERYDKRMKLMEKRLEKFQTQYYKKWDALELAYSKMSAQTSWLFQQ